MELINAALTVDLLNFRNQVSVVGFIVFVFVIGFLWSKISNNEAEIVGLTVIGVIILFVITLPITIYCNAKNETAAFAAIEMAGPDIQVSKEIRLFLNGSEVPADSWFLQDDSDVERILMTYAPVFEEKSGKPWDREFVHWSTYFEKVVKPLLKSKHVAIKD